MTRDEMQAYAYYERFALTFLRLMLWGIVGLASAFFLMCFLYIDLFGVNTTPVSFYVIWCTVGTISILRCRYILMGYREYQERMMRPLSRVLDDEN